MTILNKWRASRLIKRGAKYLKAGLYSNAETVLTEAIELTAEMPEAYFFRALARRSQEKHTEAVNDLTQSINLDPGRVVAWEVRGLTRLKTGEIEAALEDLKTAIRSGLFRAYQPLIHALIHLKRFSEAIQYCDKALGYCPREDRQALATLHALRGDAYVEWKKPGEAIVDLNKSIEFSEYPPYYISRGRAYRAQGDLEKARRDFKRAVRLYSDLLDQRPAEPELAEILGGRGIAYSEMEEREKAIQDLRKCLRMNPPEHIIGQVQSELEKISG